MDGGEKVSESTGGENAGKGTNYEGGINEVLTLSLVLFSRLYKQLASIHKISYSVGNYPKNSSKTNKQLFQTSRFSISAIQDLPGIDLPPTAGSTSTSPVKTSRFSVEKLTGVLPAPTSSQSNQVDDSDKLTEPSKNTAGRFSIKTVTSDQSQAATVPAASQTLSSGQNADTMSGDTSSNFSSGGNNTPQADGTPTSTVHSQTSQPVDSRYVLREQQMAKA